MKCILAKNRTSFMDVPKEGVAIITKTASPKKAIFLAPQKILPNFLSNFFQATF